MDNDWVYFSKRVSYWSALNTTISDQIDCLVYPNPFSEFTTIRLTDVVQIQHVEIIDISGKVISTIENINNNYVTIHRENLPGGIYFIRIHADGTYVTKVIIR